MKTRPRLILTIATGGLAGVLASTFMLQAQPERRKPPAMQVHVEAPTPKMSPVQARPAVEELRAPVDVNSRLPWKVVILPDGNWNPDKKVCEIVEREAEAQALYERMADKLTAFTAVPAARIAYFSIENKPPEYTIRAWEGSIDDVQPEANGGYTVTLTVTPTFQGKRITHNYIERYSVDADGRVTYLDSPETPVAARRPRMTFF